jgi:hypothetical protein
MLPIIHIKSLKYNLLCSVLSEMLGLFILMCPKKVVHKVGKLLR